MFSEPLEEGVSRGEWRYVELRYVELGSILWSMQSESGGMGSEWFDRLISSSALFSGLFLMHP